MSGALPLPAARHWGGQPGPVPPFPGRGGVGVGTHRRPNSLRSCKPALRAVGLAGEHSPGGCLASLWGASGSRRSPIPRPPVLWAGGRVWVCVVGVVSVCLRGRVVVLRRPWCRDSCHSFPSSAAPVPPSRPLPRVAVSCVPWCRGWWLCTLPGVRPSPLCIPCLAGAVPSSFGVPFVSQFTGCGVFYPFLCPLLVGPPPWRAFFSPLLMSLCVARLFPLPTFSFFWSFALSAVFGCGFSLSLFFSFVVL